MTPLFKRTQFTVLIEQDEDGFFVATVPALPGCSTQAKTNAELSKKVKEAIRLCLKEASTNTRYRQRIARLSYEPRSIGLELVTV